LVLVLSPVSTKLPVVGALAKVTCTSAVKELSTVLHVLKFEVAIAEIAHTTGQ